MKDIRTLNVPNGKQFRLRFDDPTDWQAIANEVVKCHVSWHWNTESTREVACALLAENFQFYKSGTVHGIFLVKWDREGFEFVVTTYWQ